MSALPNQVVVTTAIVPPAPVWIPGSIAEVIERYIAEMNGTPGRVGLKPLGQSHLYSLRALQRSALGSLNASTYRKQDVKEHCVWRRATVAPATVNQDICYLSGALDYANSEWDDCENVTTAPIKAARKSLLKHNLIGKSQPRTRTPTADELERLIAWNREKDKTSKIPMVDIILFAIASTRRLSEICRIQHGDIDWDRTDDKGIPTPMYMVRDLKHPTRKIGNNKWFPLFPELAEIILRQPRRTPDNPQERVFPVRSKSAGKRYTEGKKALGIENLRFHDNRREGTTRWLKILPPQKVKLITGHETTVILERVYDASKPEGLHAEIADIQRARATP